MPDCPEACRGIFSQKRDAKETAQQIDEAFPNCLCEKHSVSEYSPGAVDAKETLVRLIIWPGHVDPGSGEIDPKAFWSAQDIGLSVNRDDHCSDEQFKTAVQDVVVKVRERKLEKNPNTHPESLGQWHGVTECKCETIRSVIGNEGLRAFCVYDTADEAKPSHADVFKTRAIKGGAIMRKVLRESFSNLIKARQYREGRVADKLPPDFVSN